MKRIIIAFLLCSTFTFFSYCQNSLGAGFSITSAGYNSNFSTSSNSLLSFGSGFFLLSKVNLKNSEVSSLIFGAELSSIRHSFITNNFNIYGSNTSLKIPILYSFNFFPQKNTSPIVDIGINNLIQFQSEIGTTLKNDEIILTNTKHGGYFPLMQINFGFEYILKNKNSLNVRIGINTGFLKTESIKYSDKTNNIETKIHEKGSYYDVKFIYYFNRY